MLRALYDYAYRENLMLPPGYVKKTVRAYLDFSNGVYKGIYMGDGDEIPCPDVGSLTRNENKSNVIAEKRSVVIPQEDSLKSKFFLQALKSAAEYEEKLQPCVASLENPEMAAIIRADLDSKKVKDSDRISFWVDGSGIVESEKLLNWWTEYRKQFSAGDATQTELCLVTGKEGIPLKTTPPIQGLKVVGGNASGVSLICFDKDAFCSYDLKKAANAPVSEEAFSAVKLALDALIKKAPILAGMKFVHWYDRKISQQEDCIPNIFGSDFDALYDSDEIEDVEEVSDIVALEGRADSVPHSVKSGESAKNLDDVQYHILLLSGVGGRVMVRRYDRGNYAQLRKNIDLWNEDLALVSVFGDSRVKPCKLTARLLKLLKFQQSDTRPMERLSKELSGVTPAILHSILTGCSLPDTVAAKALAYIRSVMLATDKDDGSRITVPYAYQWLKVWLLRKARYEQKEVQIMETYNMEMDNVAYHCGGMMAVFAAIQMAAMPDVNASIVERFYTSAMAMPALVLGQLSSRSNHHLGKMENRWLADQYRAKLQAVASAIQSDIPTTLNLEQQSYFALGYYQMDAKLNLEKAERIAQKEQDKNLKEEM